MNKWTIVLICISVAVMLWEVISAAIGRRYVDQLAGLLVKGDFSQFDQMTEQKLVKICVAPFNMEYLKLNSYLMRGNHEKAVEMFDSFRKRSLNRAQKAEVLMSGFNYFASSGDGERALYYRDEINASSDNEEIKKRVNMLYDVLFLKKSDMLDELLKETEEMPEHLRGSNEYLIAQIYANMGDDKNADKYIKLADKHVEQMAKKGQKSNG